MAAKVPGELDEGCIFLMDVVQNPYRARFFPEKPDDVAPGPPQFTLQGFDALHRRLEVLLEKLLEDFHDERDLTLGAQREMPDFHRKDRCKNRNAPGRITSYKLALRYFGHCSSRQFRSTVFLRRS